MDLLAGRAERISVVSGKRAALSTVIIRPNGLSAEMVQVKFCAKAETALDVWFGDITDYSGVEKKMKVFG